MRIPRTRGAVGGVALILLGAFGAALPFVLDETLSFTDERVLLSVLPGLVAILGGALLVASANRAVAALGGWLGLLAGAWFVIGEEVSGLSGGLMTTLEHLGRFDGLGALILAFAGVALGRLLVRGVRDAELEAEHDHEVLAEDDGELAERPRTTRETGRFGRSDTLTAADRVREVAEDRRRPLR